jgi:hypothetical protein
LGHSVVIANEHYRVVTEEHYRHAVQDRSALQNPVQSGAAPGGEELH